MNQTSQANVDPAEIAKFERSAAQWWDPQGEFKPLHAINPLRLAFIAAQAQGLQGKTVLDVGCGGGLLSEALAHQGADVTGIDLAPESLAVARAHAQTTGLTIDYQTISAETLAKQMPEQFDIVTCMEMLEHVPDPVSIVRACAQLVKPQGQVFFATLNRTLKSYLFAIVGAEYLLQLLPIGTHHYSQFIRPAELASWGRQAGLSLCKVQGISYQPWSQQYQLSSDVNVNYLAHCQRTACL